MGKKNLTWYWQKKSHPNANPDQKKFFYSVLNCVYKIFEVHLLAMMIF